MGVAKVDPSIWDQFDAVAVISSTDYAHRKESLRAELARVGLLDRVEWFWDFDNPFMVRLANNLRLANDIFSIGGFRLNMNQYRAIKTLLELGCRHALVLEDDVRFLKDVGALADGLRSMPQDYDMAKLEWVGYRGKGTFVPDISGPWCPLSGFDTRFSAAIAYSDVGMRWRVSRLEACADYSRLFEAMHGFSAYDTSHGTGGIHAYVATPLLAVQRWTGDGVRRRGPDAYRLYGRHLAGGEVGAYAV